MHDQGRNRAAGTKREGTVRYPELDCSPTLSVGGFWGIMSEDTKRDDVLADQSQHKETVPSDSPSDYLQFQHSDLLSQDLADLQRLKLIAEIEKFAEEGKTSKLSALTSLRGSVIQAGATVLQTLGIGLATFFGINSLKPQLDLVKLEMSKLQEVQQKTAGSLKELSVGQTSLEQATREAKTATQQLRELGTQVTTAKYPVCQRL